MIMDKVKAGLVGLVTILAVFGGAEYLLQEEAENSYYCSLTNQIAVFHRLSGIGKTGYYMIDTEEKSLPCRSGNTYTPWIPLRQYIEEQGLTWEDVMQPPGGTDGNFTRVVGVQGEFECEKVDGLLGTYSKCYQNAVFANYVGELLCPAG